MKRQAVQAQRMRYAKIWKSRSHIQRKAESAYSELGFGIHEEVLLKRGVWSEGSGEGIYGADDIYPTSKGPRVGDKALSRLFNCPRIRHHCVSAYTDD